MRRKNFWRKIVSELSIISILLNSILPFGIASRAYAQETIPATTIELSSPTPSDSPIPSATPETSPLPTATSSASPEPLPAPSPTITPIANETPTPTPTPSQWTFEKVELNKEYISPQNNEVKLTFTKLPDPAGNIKIEEITLTQEQIEQTGSLSDKAYDITSDMKDGEFTYNLSLPIPESSKGKSVEVKFAEELSNIASAEKVENTLTKTDTSVSVTNLDHMTIFVVVNPAPSGASCVSAGATTETGCYSTIQAAIDASTGGETINVAAGDYVETVNVNQAVSLQGASGVNLTGSITISSDNVTINGFDITNPDAGYGVIATDHSNLTVTNNTIHDIGTTLIAGSAQAIAIISNSTNVSIIDIENNHISNIGSLSLLYNGSAGSSAKGVYLGNSTGSNTFSNVIISNNDMSNIYASTADWKSLPGNQGGAGAYGLLVNHKTTSLTISGNTIGTLEGLWAHAIGLEADTPSAVLTSNTINDLVSHKTPTDAFAVYFESNASKNTISLNDVVLGDTNSIVVDDEWTGYSNNPVVSVGGNDYIFGVNAFATIQDGIGAVAADGMVNVAAGTYNEDQILIDKPLTLQGVGKEETIIDGGETSTGGLVKIAASSGTVTLSGFTIQNTNNNDDHGHGVYVDNAGVTVNISDNAIKNVGPVGINIHAADSVQIEGNIISALYSTPDVVPNGIQIYNESFSGMGITGTIANNEIKDCSWVGYDADTDDYESNTTAAGILIIDTTATLEISNNNIHNNNVGIDIEVGSPTNIENNDIHDNAYGVVLWNENPSINNNKIENNSTGGVFRTTLGSLSGTVNAINNWWGSAVETTIQSKISGNVTFKPYWLNEGMTLPSTLIAIFDGIHTTLEDLDIANNIDTCSTHPNTCTGLYFEKSIDGNKVGKITFTASLDLTSDATQTFLQNLGDYMDANPGSMSFDATTEAGMKAAEAEIRMYGINALGYYNVASIIVRDDDGNILFEGDEGYPDLTGISYASTDGGTLIFTTEHFTQFELDQSQTTPDDSGDATLSGDTTEVVLTDPNHDVTIDIADGTDNPTIDVSAFISLVGGEMTGTLPEITINSSVADVVIPDGTVVTGPAGWDGVIAAPTVTTIDLPVISGETLTPSTAIEIGFATDKLSFDNAVRILLPGQAGKKAGYSRQGTAFTEITTICSADSQAAGDALGADGDCKIDASNGLDLVIWTKHFTKFAAYSQTTNSTSDDSNSSSSSSDTGSATTTCNDAKPSTPTLLQAIAGTNSVRLVWSEGLGSLTYYLVTYGTSSGLQQYGNQNIGGPGTTSYTINSLSGGTRYYFKIRAGNGCTTGDFSNELSAIPTGVVVDVTPEGFVPASEVLGEETTVSPSPSASPTPSSDAGAVLGATLSPLRILLGKWWFWLAIVSLGAIGYFFIRKPGDNR